MTDTPGAPSATSPEPRGRSRMRKVIRWLAWITGVFVLLLVVLVLTRDRWLKVATRQQIESSTGLRAEIGTFSTALGTGRFQVRDLKLFNPPEFGGTLMAEVPELTIDIDPEAAASGHLHFQELALRMTSLNVVKNESGRLNVEGVEKKLREKIKKRKKRKGDRMEWEFAGIDRLALSVGTVQYTDQKRPNQSRKLDLAIQDQAVTNLLTEEDLQRWMGALLFRIVMQATLQELGSQPALESPGAPATNNIPKQ